MTQNYGGHYGEKNKIVNHMYELSNVELTARGGPRLSKL